MTEQSQTAFLLIAKYGNPVVPVERIAKDYLPHLNDSQIKRQASTQALPFACFRAVKSQKGEWFCNLIDVGSWLDKSREVGLKDWQAMNG